MLLSAGCAGFTALGLWLVVENRTLMGSLAGAAAIAFFGVFGAMACWRLWRKRVILRLSATGVHPITGPAVSWGNVAAVGVGHVGSGSTAVAVVGMRLVDVEDYLSSWSAHAPRLTKGLPAFGVDVRASMAWAKEASGFDLTWSAHLFGRRPSEVVRMIQDYQRRL